MLDSSNYYRNYNLRGKYNFPFLDIIGSDELRILPKVTQLNSVNQD